MKKAIDNYLNEHQNEMLMALSGAIAIPSVKDPATANSHAPFGKDIGHALEFMLRTAEGLHFTPENLENYVGRVRWGGDGIAYAVLAHVDVVPEGTNWTVPPFAGTIKDGRLYGRGSTDDKGPAVAAIFALGAARAALEAQHIEPKNAIMLLFGTDEESGWEDFDHYFKKYGVPQSGFSPDADFPIVNGEKGILTCSWSATPPREASCAVPRAARVPTSFRSTPKQRWWRTRTNCAVCRASLTVCRRTSLLL